MAKVNHQFCFGTCTQFECNLIVLVKQNPELYDISHESYNDEEHKSEIWQKIGETLKKDHIWCIRKWLGLLAKYAKQKNSTGAEEWQYDSAMQFFDDFPYMTTMPEAVDNNAVDISTKEENGTRSRSGTF